jgi:hypothetical protein
MLKLNGKDTYINAVLISKDFLVALSIITNIRYEAIVMKCIVSLKIKAMAFMVARYAHIKWVGYIYKCSIDI